MAAITWKGVSGDWTNAVDWSSGTVPGSGDSVTISGANPFTLTLYSAAPVGGIVMNAANALFYDAGSLTLGGTFALQAGTFALAYGALNGGTLALDGGVLAADGGTLNGVAVQGALNLSQNSATLLVQNGLNLAGAGGSGQGAIALTGQYASLTFLGTQTLANAVVSFGATGPGQGQGGAAILQAEHAYGASTAATLTLAANLWLRETGTQGQLIVGGGAPGPLTDQITNQGTITDAVYGGTLSITGSGDFLNQGTIAISNGATLDVASAGFTNTGTVIVNAATLDFGGTFASALLGELGNLSLTNAIVEIGGDAVNTGATLTIGATGALGAIELTGTITGGTLIDTGGGLNLASGTGTLDGVTYKGALILGAGDVLTLLDNTSLSSATISGAGGGLLLEGQTGLNNATIAIGSSTGTAGLGTADAWLASQATTATLGAALTITQTGKFAAIDANSTTPFPGYGLADTLVNQGTITGGFAGGTLTVGGGGIFINQAMIAISNGDTLDIAPVLFANTGTISVSGGATAILGGPANIFGVAPAWSNTGLITVNNATLDLSGTLQTGQLGRISETNGSVVLAGTLNNAGATLALGAGGGLGALSLTGTIDGGAITDAGGLLAITTARTALLDGVTDIGTLNLTQQADYLRIEGGLTLQGQANLTGAGADMAFEGSQVFDKATLNLGATGTAATIDILQDPASYAASTLTLGPNLTINQAGALADIGAAGDSAGDAILSYGTINAAQAGGDLTIAGAAFVNHGIIAVSGGDTLALTTASFTNAGTVSITSAALLIEDSVTLTGLGHLNLANAAISIAGTLAEGGGTLAIGAGTAWGRVSLTGTIEGGTIADAGGGLNQGGQATLENVTYEGVLDLSRPFQQLTLDGGITLTDSTGRLPGTVMLTGAASRLVSDANETLANATIYLGSASETYLGQHVPAPELDAAANTTLTLAANTLLRTAGIAATLGNCALGDWSDTIVNDGTILAATPTGTLGIGASFFTNNGGLVIGNTGNALFTGVDFINAGQLSLTGGSTLSLSLYGYYAAPNSGPTPFSNAGTIHMLGGLLAEQTGNGLFPAVPLLNQAGGLIQGFGEIAAPVLNDSLIEAKYGPNLQIAGAISGSGTLQIDPGCVLELGSTVSAGQTVLFTATSETLRLDAPSGFAGTVSNFTSGDTIDVAGSPVNTVAISGGTLVLGTSYGVFKLADANPLGGEVAVASDHHGGDLVTYTQQSSGGGGTGGGNITIIEATQPKMLFWASPYGDEFQGASANLNGAVVANWTTTDTLDFVDLLGTKTTVAYAQASGQGTITVTEGNLSASVTLLGSYNATWFHVTSGSGGEALITYSSH
jgi:fibronectin-binding autotransporter adhesin